MQNTYYVNKTHTPNLQHIIHNIDKNNNVHNITNHITNIHDKNANMIVNKHQLTEGDDCE